MANACTANNKCLKEKVCDHVRQATTTDYNLQVLYERHMPEKKAQIHWKGGIVASCYIMIDIWGDMAVSIIIETY